MAIENQELIDTINLLKKDKRAFWKAVAKILERPKRKRVAVNIGKINKLADDGKIVIIPGKVLSTGELTKKVVIAAFSYSKRAKEIIEKSGNRAITIKDAYNELKNFQDALIII